MIGIDCAYCIDGLAPAGIDPIFGPVYRSCHTCAESCRDCGGMAIFPGMFEYFAYLVDALYHLGYELDVCRDCCGITALHPATDVEKGH